MPGPNTAEDLNKNPEDEQDPKEDPKKEEPKGEDPKKEDPKEEDPKEEPKKEDPKGEDPKEEPKKEDPKEEPDPGSEPPPPVGKDTKVDPDSKQEATDGQGTVDNLVDTAVSNVANLPVVNLELKAIRQDELKTFSAEYSSQKAVQRTYRPQGFFGLANSDQMKANKYFIEVDANDEFWRQFKVMVHGPSDFAKVGLRSAAVQLEYGDPKDPKAKLVTDSFRFDTSSGSAADKEFSKPMYRGQSEYRYSITYSFDPLSGWEGEQKEQTTPKLSSGVRDAYVIPQRDFSFLVVNASFANEPDWNQLSQIHLQLEYPSTLSKAAPNPRESFKKTVVITRNWVPTLEMAEPEPGKLPPQLPWKLRLKDPKAPAKISYKLIYVLKNGKKQESPVMESDSPVLVLDSPFRSKTITVRGRLVDWNQVDSVEVQLQYGDPGKRAQPDALIFDKPDGNERAPDQSVSLSLGDDTVYRWKATYLMADGSDDRVIEWTTRSLTEPAVTLPKLPARPKA